MIQNITFFEPQHKYVTNNDVINYNSLSFNLLNLLIYNYYSVTKTFYKDRNKALKIIPKNLKCILFFIILFYLAHGCWLQYQHQGYPWQWSY